MHTFVCCFRSFLWTGCSPAGICHLEATSELRSLGLVLQWSAGVELKAFPYQFLMTGLRVPPALPCLCCFSHRKLDPVLVDPPHTKQITLKVLMN